MVSFISVKSVRFEAGEAELPEYAAKRKAQPVHGAWVKKASDQYIASDWAISTLCAITTRHVEPFVGR
jgi:hypothetical protein